MGNTLGADADHSEGVYPSVPTTSDHDPVMASLEGGWSWPEEFGISPGPAIAAAASAPVKAAARTPTAGRLTLREVAVDRVDLVAEKMKLMPEEQLEEIKAELRSIMEGLDSGSHVDEFLCLRKLVQGRDDLTPATLSVAHRVQLVLLVAINTGIKTFMDPSVVIPTRELADILLERRCHNIDCLSALPVGGCGCSICAGRKGFCRNCTCMICNNKFNFDVYSCLWFECGVCCHCAHTDCAMFGGQIGVGQTTDNGTGHAKMLFRCLACQGTSELFAWVTELFRYFAPDWDRDELLLEFSIVCKMFSLSEDTDERKFVTKCAELLGRLSSGSDESTCRKMLLQELQEMKDKEHMHEALERILVDTSVEPLELSYAFLESITNGFSQEIGSGGFGVVYMGVLQNKKVAVKKLFQTKDFSDKQFEDELTCLRRVKHKNIVRFLGYCADTEEEPAEYNGRFVLAEVRRRFLCFEYIPNKSLRDYLKDEPHSDWDTRYRLIEGICDGLCYLHNVERINHLDLKPENILLDVGMVPKITDFGLSRRFSGEQTRIITKNIRGSRGYIAPEYWTKGEISFKSDIFSLGVIIREVLCGSIDSDDYENWYQSLDIDNPQMKRCIEIAQLCVEYDSCKRPTIDCIIDMLSEKETVVEMISPVFGHSGKNPWSSKEQDEMENNGFSKKKGETPEFESMGQGGDVHCC
ncbi:hypothetical protein ACP70R_007831 [Stipagrostis hirtigluma subsp. patula]